MPYLHKHLEGKISDEEFDAIANDAIKLSVDSQLRAGVDIITDGEQRRDNYASFVGLRLEGCQLIPVTDLLPLVDDPEKFQEELKSLDVPAEKVRHPAVFGNLSRKPGGIAGRELSFLKSICSHPAKIALPGPYLLSRLMWMDCITDKVYKSREELACAAANILREEIADLLANGAAIVQLDEPVLSEIVFTGAKNTRSFMCGALSERGNQNEELDFARELINKVCDGFPEERLAMHICRGNWTPDESAALSGSYEPLLPLLNSVNVGTVFLEFCTPRAGEIEVLKNIRSHLRIGLGSVNQKLSTIESVDSIVGKAKSCIEIIGADRLLLNPDCGFATFADNPVSSAGVAEAKLSALKHASELLKKEFVRARLC
jgi:5-methyltetrahydropteroyltriglutamate--homocysteine methyltransferase